MSVLTDYVSEAMKSAVCEKMEDGNYFCSVPALTGAWGSGPTKRAAMAELRDVLEEWLVAALRDDEDLPEIGGTSLNFAGRRWPRQSRVESSSPSYAR